MRPLPLRSLPPSFDVCRGWLPETDLPPLLRQWTRTDTRREPCTFRGIDFEMQNLRADAGGKGIAVSALRSDADFNAVMRYPELVLKHDWPALARATGVYTNEKHLRDLVKRCFEKSLTDAALKERGLQQLLARLRATDGGTAPRALLPLATAPSTDLGVGGPLPFINGVVGARQVEIRHDLGAAASPRSASASTSTSASASVLPAATDTRRRFLERRAQREREKYAASRGDEYTPRANTGGPTSKSKERRAQHERDKYAASRGDAYKPRVNARGPRPSKRQRTQPNGEVS